MALSLYDLSVPSFIQTVEAVSGFMAKGLAHCAAANLNPNDVVDTRLAPDMLPFRFQILSVAHHSLGALNGVRQGLFQPPEMLPLDYAGLQARVSDTLAGLQKLTPAEVNGWLGRDVIFKLGERQIPFVAENFLMSFSLPNFYFHATTAYDILRSKGAPLGKRDYLGKLRFKS